MYDNKSVVLIVEQLLDDDVTHVAEHGLNVGGVGGVGEVGVHLVLLPPATLEQRNIDFYFICVAGYYAS